MIQWTGDNLKELVHFTGKSPKFEEWFKTWEDFENYVHTHNNIFKIFNEDGSHVEVPVGAWIIKTPDGYNVASRYVFKKKPADKIEPKFKVGDWITNGEYTWNVTDIKPLDYVLQSQNGDVADDAISYVDEEFHLWTIEDAKDGDVLAEHETIVLFKKIEGQNIRCYCTYHYLGFNNTFYVCTLQNKNPYFPATKEQCDLLFKKMREAGYVWWYAEKKELKKIEPKFMPGECIRYRGENYKIKNIEKTKNGFIYNVSIIGKPSDPEEVKTAIGFASEKDIVKIEQPSCSENVQKIRQEIERKIEICEKYLKLNLTESTSIGNYAQLLELREIKDFIDSFLQEPSWSEEDEKFLNYVISLTDDVQIKNFIKSLKDRVQPHTKQEWSEEDEKRINSIISSIEYCLEQYPDRKEYVKDIDWLKSLNLNNWRPSEEQMQAFENCNKMPYNALGTTWNTLQRP